MGRIIERRHCVKCRFRTTASHLHRNDDLWPWGDANSILIASPIIKRLSRSLGFRQFVCLLILAVGPHSSSQSHLLDLSGGIVLSIGSRQPSTPVPATIRPASNHDSGWANRARLQTSPKSKDCCGPPDRTGNGDHCLRTTSS